MKSYFPKGVPDDFFAYDDLYAKGSRLSSVPVAMYRAIASRETGNNPELVNKRTAATGLLQLLPPVWHDWNKKIALPRGDEPVNQRKLLNPEVNVAVGSWLMGQIMSMFRRHPQVQIDWTSMAFVELFIFAYHAGLYGTEKTIILLEQEGKPITVEAVVEKAKTALKDTFPYAQKKPQMLDAIIKYDKGTAILFEKTRTLKAPPKLALRERPARSASGPGLAIAAGAVIALGAALFTGGKA